MYHVTIVANGSLYCNNILCSKKIFNSVFEYIGNLCYCYLNIVTWFNYFYSILLSLSCLLSNTAFGFGVEIIARLEQRDVGVLWQNIGDPITLDSSFNLAWVIGMLLIDSFIYMILAWWVQHRLKSVVCWSIKHVVLIFFSVQFSCVLICVWNFDIGMWMKWSLVNMEFQSPSIFHSWGHIGAILNVIRK